MSSTNQRYTPLQIALHWFTLLLFVALYASVLAHEAFGRDDPMRANLMRLHMSLGILSAMVLVVRLAAKFTGPRLAPEPGPAWMQKIAQLGHLGLYVLMFGLPITGMLFTTLSGRPPAFFGLPLPALLPENKELGGAIKEVHEVLATLGYFLVGLHAAAALYHHHVLKDGVLARMLPGRRA